jgi:LCP family protein required for cell wall assembly
MADLPERGRLARWFLATTATLSLLLAGLAAYGLKVYRDADAALRHFDEPLPPPPDGSDEPDFGPCAEDVCNYLILGSDSRKGLSPEEQEVFGTDKEIGGENRSDTIILVQTDPRRDKAVIVSFPRDLWVEIPGKGSGKINSAFEGGIDGGGPQLVARTVERLTGLDINHLLYVDLAGFEGIVDTLGGVDMCIPYDIYDPLTALDLEAGCQRLDGHDALGYVRTRHLPCDSVPDFARIGRQQQFLRAVINRLLQPEELIQAPRLVKPIARNLVTDRGFDLGEVIYLVNKLHGLGTTDARAEFRAVPGTPTLIYPEGYPGGLSVVRMDPAARDLFRALREGGALPDVGTELQGTPTSPANIVAGVVDDGNPLGAADAFDVLSTSGFDIRPGVIDPAAAGLDPRGSAVVFRKGLLVEGQVVAQFFPGLDLVKAPRGALDGMDVAVVVTADYRSGPVGEGPDAPSASDCIDVTP